MEVEAIRRQSAASKLYFPMHIMAARSRLLVRRDGRMDDAGRGSGESCSLFVGVERYSVIAAPNRFGTSVY